MTEETIRAWHFLPADRKLTHGDGREVVVGETLSASPSPSIGRRGLHACPWISDALSYAPGPVLCLVDVWGDLHADEDKVAGRHRRVIEMHDVTRELHEFACAAATFALENEMSLGRVPDPRSYEAIQARLGWLRGDVDDDELARAALTAWEEWAPPAASAASVTAWAAFRAAAWTAPLASTAVAAALFDGGTAARGVGPAAEAAVEGFALDTIGVRFEGGAS